MVSRAPSNFVFGARIKLDGAVRRNVSLAYQTGAARGDYSILSAMDVQQEELFATFGQSINDLILRHRRHLARKRETLCAGQRSDIAMSRPAAREQRKSR